MTQGQRDTLEAHAILAADGTTSLSSILRLAKLMPTSEEELARNFICATYRLEIVKRAEATIKCAYERLGLPLPEGK